MGRKAKATPASSAKALELCGDASRLGVSAADVFAQYAAPRAGALQASVEDSEAAKVDDAEISLALHALQKKDPITRLRGVGELKELLAGRPAQTLKEACAPFLHLYRRLWPQDAEPRVREGLQRCLQALVEALQRDFQRHLRSAFPTWLCAMFDTHAEVASAARRAFAASFPSDDKRRGVFRHCQSQCQGLLTANLSHTEQSLHDELGMSGAAAGDRNLALERQDRYARVIAASLSALGELVHVCASVPPGGAQAPLGAEELAPLLAAGGLCSPWSRLSLKQPSLVRRAAAECLLRLLQSEAATPAFAAASHRAAAIGTLADEAVPLSVSVGLLCSFARAGGSECWEGLNAAKSLWPQLLGALRRGGAGEAGLLAKLPELLAALPTSAWGPGRGEAVLQTLLEALHKPRTPAVQVWRGYFAVVRAADAAGSPVAPCWRWAPLEMYLGSRTSPAPGPAGSAEAAPQLCAAPEAALVALPEALAPAWPALLAARCEAAAELLGVLEAGAPALPGGAPAAGPPDGAARGAAKPWVRWLSLLGMLLRDRGAEERLLSRASELLASQARGLLGSLARAARPGAGAAPAAPETHAGALLAALGELLATDEVQPEPSWIPAADDAEDAGQAAARLPRHEDWPAEARLLAWPILPCWRAWTAADGLSEAAETLGDRVVLPLLRRALRRHAAGFPAIEVRDMVLAGLLGTAVDDRDAGRLSAAVQLSLRCLPRDLEVAAAPPLRAAVAALADLVAEGAPAGEGALLLALQPGCLAAADARGCLERLVRPLLVADDPGERELRLAVLCGGALSMHSKGPAEGSDEQDSRGLSDLRGPVCGALLAALARGGDIARERDAAARALLPRVLPGLSLRAVSKALGAPPGGAGARRRWAQLLVEAGAAAGLPALSLLLECRGGPEAPRARGRTSPAQLRHHALATREVLQCCGVGAPGALDALPEPDLLALLWELLLARAAGTWAAPGGVDAPVWQWLESAPGAARGRLARFCAAEAAGEGHSWWLELEAPPGRSLPQAAGLHALAPMQAVLRAAWRTAASAQDAGARELLRWALDDARRDHAEAAGWGQVVAVVVGRAGELSISDDLAAGGPVARAALADWRAELHAQALAKGLSAPLLYAAAAVERWAAPSDLGAAPHVASGDGGALAEEASRQPVIAEAGEAAAAAAPEREQVTGEIDTGFLDTHERLLRWSQGSQLDVRRADAFAEYAAATWAALGAAGAGEPAGQSSKEVSRLRRLASEVLQAPQAVCAPGVLRLVAALGRAGAWPEGSWPAAVQAVSEADGLAADPGRGAEEDGGQAAERAPARAFADDAVSAAAEVLPLVPATCAARVVPLLGARSAVLQAAAAARLRSHAWVPADRGDVAAGQPAETLQQLEEMLQEQEDGEADGRGPASLPAGPGPSGGPCCGDVIHATLGAVVGPELLRELWAVDAALASFLDWESAEAEGGSSGESGSEAGSDGGAAPGEAERAADSTGQGPGERAAPEELPAGCRRAALAALAAWELLLLGMGPAPGGGRAPGPPRNGAGRAGDTSGPAAPGELVASALQLTPDQLAGLHGPARAWRAGAAPPLEGGWSPLQPLLRLLFHALTCRRLVGEAGAEPRVREALARGGAALAEAPPSPNGALLALASRVLLLALERLPGAVRAFWEALPRRRDRDLVEALVAKSFSPLLMQSEAASAAALLEAQKDRLEDVEASVARRPKQLALQLARDELRAELLVQIPEGFPLRPAVTEMPEKMPGIPRPRVRNWMLQARQVLVGPKPMVVGRAMSMWARSFALFFEGVEDCPICYNVVHLSTQTIPRKACPTCKHKFHSECLYHWFKTSAKTTCPLCSQPF